MAIGRGGLFPPLRDLTPIVGGAFRGGVTLVSGMSPDDPQPRVDRPRHDYGRDGSGAPESEAAQRAQALRVVQSGRCASYRMAASKSSRSRRASPTFSSDTARPVSRRQGRDGGNLRDCAILLSGPAARCKEKTVCRFDRSWDLLAAQTRAHDPHSLVKDQRDAGGDNEQLEIRLACGSRREPGAVTGKRRPTRRFSA